MQIAEDLTEVDPKTFKYRVVRWQSLQSRLVERFSTILEDEKLRQTHFGNEYLQKLVEKIRRDENASNKLTLIQALLLLTLFVELQGSVLSIEIFGITAASLAAVKEFVLLTASLLGATISTLHAHKNYVEGLIEAVVKKTTPPSLYEFAIEPFKDNYFSFLSRGSFAGWIPHGASLSLLLFFSVALVGLLILVVVAALYIQLSVLWDVIKNPATVWYVNYFVITTAVLALSYSTSLLVLRLPLPHVEYSGVAYLKKLEAADPEKYRQFTAKVGTLDKIRERRSRKVYSFVIFLAAYMALPAVISNVPSHGNPDYWALMPLGFLFSYFLLPRWVNRFEDWRTRSFFKRHPRDDLSRKEHFLGLRKRLRLIRQSCLVLLDSGFAYFLLTIPK